MSATPKVMPPVLCVLCWPTTCEVDGRGMAAKSWTFPPIFHSCCGVTDVSIGVVCQNGIWHRRMREAKGVELNSSIWKKFIELLKLERLLRSSSPSINPRLWPLQTVSLSALSTLFSVSVVVSMELNRSHYFQSGLRTSTYLRNPDLR